jgi:hypothetical protein
MMPRKSLALLGNARGPRLLLSAQFSSSAERESLLCRVSAISLRSGSLPCFSA